MSSVLERLKQAAAPADRRLGGRLVRYSFGLAFAFSAAMTAFTIWRALRAPTGTTTVVGPLHSIFLGLGLNLVLILMLAGMVAWRVWKVFANREQDAGAKLHLRYMTLFALAAAVPAGVVALFFGVLVNQGVDSWFSAKIRTVVNNHREVARTLVEMQSERLTTEIAVAQKDINGYIGELRSNPARFNALLVQEAGARQFLWIYVVDGQGKVLARAERPGAPDYAPPGAEKFAEVDRNPESPPTDLLPAADMARIVLRVRGGGSEQPIYAVIGAPMPAGLLDRLAASYDAVEAYNDAEANRGRVQIVFLLSYIETALLVLVGSIWLGLGAANAIALPVARLVQAANRVAAGDLDARVESDPRSPEELENLSLSFNRMTDDLQHQQKALKDASEEAEDRRQFIETVLGGVSAGVLGLDPEGRISACNSQAIRLLGLDPLLAQGMPLAEVAPELAPVLERAMTTGHEAEEDVDLLRSRETRHLRVRASGHARDGLVLTFDDITKLVSAQRNAAWKDVARRIAHEIKNPLTPIQLSAERLRRKYRDEIKGDLETFDRCTDTIVRQVGDIGRMVDEFSAFARMPAPKFTTADAAELLREVVFARRVAHPEIEIDLQIKGEPGRFVCDDRMVAQALSNVLKNAAEAISARRQEDPDLEGRIIASLSGDRQNLVFEVQDNGVGLPDKDRARLTEPYVTTREKGTGLGLAIVKRILEDHAGQLFLRDPPKAARKPVRGALVVLQFPRGAPADLSKKPATNTREDA